MKRLQLWVRAFFGFSRFETNGFLILIPLVFILLFSEPLFRNWSGPPAVPDLDKTDSLLAWLAIHNSRSLSAAKDSIEFRIFDPNTITEKELVAFGLNDRTANRWIRYREKGGRFRTVNDVGKIYGMDTTWLAKARRWLQIPAENRLTTQKKKIVREDINVADSLSLLDVYGIGPALARRILLFRSRLGGFVSMEQLAEVYGLDTVVVLRLQRQFQVMPGYEPEKIDLESVTFEDLVRHPYVSRKQAQAIVTYRSQHGLSSPQELRRVNALDSLWLARMLPYLKMATP